ncbi:MAG: hypothetical protein LBS50_02795 [Prevotellaceae bacterium]|jgi:hypothetical protein|nr:hypothetical protein [Prevotellaceae bacterium]
MKILTGAFWLIMAVHFVVFAIIGVVSGNWKLILIFVPLLTVTIGIKFLIYFVKNRKKE